MEGKLFDANVLLGPLPRSFEGVPEDVPALLATMDAFGVDYALTTHTLSKWHDPTSGNVRLAEEVVDQPRLVGCSVVLPASTGEVPSEGEQVEQLLASGSRAARLCPVAHRLSLEPWVLERLLGALAERRVPLLLDLDNRHWSEPRPWQFIEWSCRSFPALPLVLLHEGHADFRTLFPLMERCSNLVIETSYLQGHDAVRIMVERWGPDRLVFGTGMPVWDPALSITGLTYAGLDTGALAAVGSRTLRTLLNGCLL